MLMKVFNKGQVVIPAELRRSLGISVGDLLDVSVNRKSKCVQLRPNNELKSQALAGSLAKYARGNKFPTRKQMAEALKRGLRHDA